MWIMWGMVKYCFNQAIIFTENFMGMFEDRCILVVLKEHILKAVHDDF